MSSDQDTELHAMSIGDFLIDGAQKNQLVTVGEVHVTSVTNVRETEACGMWQTHVHAAGAIDCYSGRGKS